jgi:hypothetical protein
MLIHPKEIVSASLLFNPTDFTGKTTINKQQPICGKE